MKKVLLSAVVALSTLGIVAANSGTSNVKATKTSYVVKDTTPTTDTTKKDSTLLLK